MTCYLYPCSPGTPSDVTYEAVWDSGDTSILRVVGAGRFDAVGLGDTFVHARSVYAYEGWRTVSVFPGLPPQPTGEIFGSIYEAGKTATVAPIDGALIEVIEGLLVGRTATSGVRPPLPPGFTPHGGPGYYRLLAVPAGTYRLRAKDVLMPDLNRVSKKGQRFCEDVEERGSRSKPRIYTCCLMLLPGSNEIAAIETVRKGGWGPEEAAVKSPVRFELTEVVWPTAPPRSAIREEIVYQGAAAGVLRMLYREYVDDLVRAAFSQELTYDYTPGQPMTISVKGAKIEVRGAGNTGIDYIVLNGLR